LVVGEVALEVDAGDVGRKPFPAAAAVLAHGALPLEQREDDARLAAGYVGGARDVVACRALAGREPVHHARDADRFLDVRILAAEEVALDGAVFDAVQDGAERRRAVASRAPGFLV